MFMMHNCQLMATAHQLNISLEIIKLVLLEVIEMQHVNFPRHPSGERSNFLHSDIFIICFPMFPPFIMEQNASARKLKKCLTSGE